MLIELEWLKEVTPATHPQWNWPAVESITMKPDRAIIRFKDGDSYQHCWFRLTTGVYLSGLNFGHTVDDYSTFRWIEPWGDTSELGPWHSYGVADDVRQIIKRNQQFLESPRRFVLSCSVVRRHEQSPDGGWRWHRWGPYIGVQEPRCEYLYDEPAIKRAVIYHFHEVEPK